MVYKQLSLDSLLSQTSDVIHVREHIYCALARMKIFLSSNPAGFSDPESARKRSGRRLARASSSYKQGRDLSRLAAYQGRRIGRPIEIFELGTCCGISAMYIACGLSKAFGGKIVSFEGRPELANLARRNFRNLCAKFSISNVELEIHVGDFDESLEDLRSKGEMVGDGGIFFVDGNHHEQPTLRYQEVATQCVGSNGIVVHDDISWSDEMILAWTKIRDNEQGRAVICERNAGGKPDRGFLFYGLGHQASAR